MVIVIGFPEIVPVPDNLESPDVQLNDPLRPSLQVILPVPREIDFMSNVPEHDAPVLEVTVNGADVSSPAVPDPVNVSDPSDSCPVTGNVVLQAAVMVSNETAISGPNVLRIIEKLRNQGASIENSARQDWPGCELSSVSGEFPPFH